MKTMTPVSSKALLDAIGKAQRGDVARCDVLDDPQVSSGKHEFLFFIKPELTASIESLRHERIFDIVLEKIAGSGLRIRSIMVLSGSYLKERSIIAEHYGVIARLAKSARTNLSTQARDSFAREYKESADGATILGGFEFLDEFPAFNPLSLDYFWQARSNQKLAPGTYCEKVKLDARTVYVINGFHPRQLTHYTDPGKSIVVMVLTGDIGWKAARNEFIGATIPANAVAGSLRSVFLEKKQELGIPEVSQAMNGVHLSAGPVEGLIELVRFTRPESTTAHQGLFAFEKLLTAEFAKHQISQILSNPTLEHGGRKVSVFDLTEEKDADEAVSLLKAVFPK